MRRGLLSIIVFGACGGDGGSVSATARLYNGATPAGVAFVGPILPPAPPENGNWLVSPDRLTMKLTRVGLTADSGGDSEPVDCPVTYDESKPGLAQLGDCAFGVPPGTYTKLSLTFGTTISVLVDDAATGLFSTATGLQTTAPAGGAQNYTYELAGFNNGEAGLSPISLPEPVTVADGDSVELAVVISALQSLRFTVAGSTVTPGWSGTTYSDPGRPDIVGTVGSLAKIKHYASPALNTASSYCAGGCANPPQGITSVGIYYTSATAIAMAGLQLNGPPANCLTPGSGSFVNDPRSYVGLDGNNVAGWAGASDASWTTYTVLYAMPQVANLGDSTALYCSPASGNPDPSGGSFASGAPAIQTAGNSLGNYVLVAQ